MFPWFRKMRNFNKKLITQRTDELVSFYPCNLFHTRWTCHYWINNFEIVSIPKMWRVTEFSFIQQKQFLSKDARGHLCTQLWRFQSVPADFTPNTQHRAFKNETLDYVCWQFIRIVFFMLSITFWSNGSHQKCQRESFTWTYSGNSFSLEKGNPIHADTRTWTPAEALHSGWSVKKNFWTKYKC